MLAVYLPAEGDMRIAVAWKREPDAAMGDDVSTADDLTSSRHCLPFPHVNFISSPAISFRALPSLPTPRAGGGGCS